MLKNYFIVAVRNFWRNKVFSFINILGLSIGICTSLSIFLIVSYDLSFDHFHKDTNRIYRVVSSLKSMGEESPGPGVTINLPGAITRELTGVNAVVPLYTWDKYPDITVDAGISKVVVFKKQKNIVFTNADYFKVFNYTWLTGSPQASLSKPYQVVLTQSAARLYFPQLLYTQVTGRQLVIDTTTVTVSGIVKDITQNTDLTFTAFLSQPSLTKILFKGEDLWDDNEPSSQVFVKLSPGTTPARLTANINALYARHYKPATGNNVSLSFALQPLGDLHFNAGYGNYFNNHLAHKPTLWALLAVAAFILLLACINFINLATAQASKRAKEIGLRKTMGGSKKQLVFQFLSETFLLTLMAALLSVILIPFLLKLFSGFIPRGVTFNIVKQPGILIFLFTLVTSVSLLSGFYPAVILSSCKPVLVLKNSSGNMGKSRFAWMRRFLIVTQFVIAQVFIIATIIVCRQINYSVNSNLGFKKDGIVYFNTYFSRNQAQRQVLLQKIRAIPGVAGVSLSTNPPSTNRDWSSSIQLINGTKTIETEVEVKLADTGYIKLYRLQLLAGGNLPYSDSLSGVIINTSYLRAAGLQSPQQAIGKPVVWLGKRIPIVGVVADFHQKSLHETIKPLIIANWTADLGTFNIALQPQNAAGTVWQNALAKIEEAYKQVYPAAGDFTYSFVDDTVAAYYTTEQNTSQLLMWATGITMAISSLGLLALVIYTTSQRTKEIGIRKIVGATVMQIITLLCKDFLKPVALAFVIAIPVTWWGAHKWLENFAYTATMPWWLFAAGGLAMLAIAFLVMFARTYRAAMANPAESLRTE